MKKKIKWILAALAAVFALLQLFNPSHANPPTVPGHDLMAASPPPLPVAALLQSACYDCHSDRTEWPWYSRIAPVSWLIASDVNQGRQHINLSDWPVEFPERAAKRLERMSEEIDYGNMPPAKYTLLHTNARLTKEQRKTLTDWLDQEAARLKTTATNK